jgi:hypothetical protein
MVNDVERHDSNLDRLSILQSAQGNPALVALAAVNIAHDSLHA